MNENTILDGIAKALEQQAKNEQGFEEEYEAIKALTELPNNPLEGAEDREIKLIMLIHSWFHGGKTLSKGKKDFHRNFPVVISTIIKILLDEYIDDGIAPELLKVLAQAKKDKLSVEDLLKMGETDAKDYVEKHAGETDQENDSEIPIKTPGE